MENPMDENQTDENQRVVFSMFKSMNDIPVAIPMILGR